MRSGLIAVFRDIFEKQDYPVTYMDTDYNILYANRAATETFEIPPAGETKCYRLHGLDRLPDKCYCGYGTPDIRVTKVFMPSMNRAFNHIYLPIRTNGSFSGAMDIYTRIKDFKSTVAPMNGNNQPIVLENVTDFNMYVPRSVKDLTAKENEVLGWIKKGKSPAEISRLMKISGNTVNFHLKNIFNKLGADNRAHAVALAYEADLAKKELHLQEMNHRVKNNFAIISSIMNLQSSKLKDKASRTAMRNIDSLLRNFVSLQNLLLDSSGTSHVPAKSFFEQAISNLSATLSELIGGIRISHEIESTMLHMNTAIPCVQIISELISNAMEHAFMGKSSGEILVSFRQTAAEGSMAEYALTIKDNGIGLPEGFDILKSDSLGMRIVSALVSQIDGRMELDSQNGTGFTIYFSEPKAFAAEQ